MRDGAELRLKVKVHGRHPWFYRKMIRRPDAQIPAGSAVWVRDRDGTPVGTGFYNPRTELALRMLARERVEDPDAFLAAALDRAIELRRSVLGLDAHTDGYRLVHSEGDGFPGLVVDKLGDAIVAQVFSLCMMQRIEGIGERLAKRFQGARLVLCADDHARELEGFEAPQRAAPFETTVTEHGIAYRVRPGQDHKTGFFADQRDQRARVRVLAKGRRVLDLCCNSGGFAINAARGGARSVLAADLDEAMVDQAKQNAKKNGASVQVEHGDAFDVLREAKQGAHDLIILDPPKWIFGRAQVDENAGRYRDLNELALKKVDRGGIVVTCSCSGALSEGRFLQILAEAAAAAGRDPRALWIGGAGPDHPVAIGCPETRYLKVAVLAL